MNIKKRICRFSFFVLFFISAYPLYAQKFSSISTWKDGTYYNYTQGYKFSLSGEWKEVVNNKYPKRFYINKRGTRFEVFSFLLPKNSFQKQEIEKLTETLLKDYRILSLNFGKKMEWGIKKVILKVQKKSSHKDTFAHLLLYAAPYKGKLVFIGVLKEGEKNFEALDINYFFNSILSIQTTHSLTSLTSKWIKARKQTVGLKFTYPYPFLLLGKEKISKKKIGIRTIELKNKQKIICNSYIQIKRDMPFINIYNEFEVWREKSLAKDREKLKIKFQTTENSELIVNISYIENDRPIYRKVLIKKMKNEVLLFHIQSPILEILNKENFFTKLFESITPLDINAGSSSFSSSKPVEIDLEGQKLSLIFPNSSWIQIPEKEREKLDWEAINAFQSKKNKIKLLIYSEKIIASRKLYFYQSIAFLKWKQKGDIVEVMPSLSLPYHNSFWKLTNSKKNQVRYLLFIKKRNSFLQFVFYRDNVKSENVAIRGNRANLLLEKELSDILNSIEL